MFSMGSHKTSNSICANIQWCPGSNILYIYDISEDKNFTITTLVVLHRKPRDFLIICIPLFCFTTY